MTRLRVSAKDLPPEIRAQFEAERAALFGARRELEQAEREAQELALDAAIRAAGLPEPVKQYQFCPTRKWRADFAYPDQRVLIEVEGGIWTQGRHVRGQGYINDIEKYTTAALMGFTVVRLAPEHIENGIAIAWIRQALGRAGL